MRLPTILGAALCGIGIMNSLFSLFPAFKCQNVGFHFQNPGYPHKIYQSSAKVEMVLE